MELLNEPIVLVLLFIIGVVFKLFPFTPKNLHSNINQFILYIPLPAIVILKIPQLEISQEVLFPIAAAWITFIMSIVFAFIVCKVFKYDNKTMACLILCGGLGNTSFVGFPFIKHFYGNENLQYAIFVDQPGSFLILSTFGVLIATSFSSSKLNLLSMLFRLIKFPPFLIFIFALFLPTNWCSPTTTNVLEFIGKWMVPLAIFSLGLQFNLSVKDIDWKKLSAGLAYKLVIAPFIIYILFFWIFKKEGIIYEISVLECAMPPMITSSILATKYKLDESLATYLPTIGILISTITLLLWKWIL